MKPAVGSEGGCARWRGRMVTQCERGRHPIRPRRQPAASDRFRRRRPSDKGGITHGRCPSSRLPSLARASLAFFPSPPPLPCPCTRAPADAAARSTRQHGQERQGTRFHPSAACGRVPGRAPFFAGFPQHASARRGFFPGVARRAAFPWRVAAARAHAECGEAAHCVCDVRGALFAVCDRVCGGAFLCARGVGSHPFSAACSVFPCFLLCTLPAVFFAVTGREACT